MDPPRREHDATDPSWYDRHGPNAAWPRGVAWRRDDATIADDTASFGAAAKRIFPR